MARMNFARGRLSKQVRARGALASSIIIAPMRILSSLAFVSLGIATALLGSGSPARAQAREPSTAALAPPAGSPEQNPPHHLTPRAQAETFYEVFLAELLTGAGDYASSHELLMRAGQTRNDPQLFERAAEVAFMAQDGNRALRAAQAWQQAEPQSREANKAVLQVLLALGQIPQTQWHLKQELRLTPDSEMAESLYAIPLVYQHVANKELVLHVVQAALQEQLQVGSPWRADALAALGRIHLQAEQPDQAIGKLQQGHEYNPASSGVAFLALELLAQGRQQALPIAQSYAQDEQALPEFLLAYSRLLLSQQNDAQALATLERLTARQPGYAEAWLAQAALQAGAGQYAKAELSVDQFDLLLDNLPGSLAKERGRNEAYVLRAQIAEQQGQNERALEWLERVDDPQQYLHAQVQRAALLAKQGRIAEARGIIQQLPAQNEQDETLKLRAEVQLLRDNGLAQEAYRLHQKLANAQADDDDVLYEHAMLAERAGATAEMESLLRRIIARSPGFYHAKNALGYSLAERNVQLDEARALIEQALSAVPGDPYITDSLGWLEYRAGNLQRAQELLLKAFNARPDADIAAHLGEVLWKLGQRGEAREIWTKGLLLNPDNRSLQDTIRRLDHSHARP